jgi:DNA end-binding protein Ku
MPARPISSATISFGLVSVPIKLYSTGDSSANVSFNWIHKDCGSRLRQQYICSREGSVVEKDQMVKGYEFAKDQYVLFNDEELKALEQKADSTIEIVEFVPAEKVTRVYMDKPYYLGPDKGGDRAYRLLSKAMRETGLSALGRYAARGKQYLVLLSPMADGLIMEQLRYADEVRSFEEVPLGEADVKDTELKLAIQLIQQIAADEFHPENYRDEVRDRTLALIEKKIQGEDITKAPVEEPKTQIIDLMEALKASLAKSKPPEDAEEEESSATARKAPKRASSEAAASAKKAGGKRKAGGA